MKRTLVAAALLTAVAGCGGNEPEPAADTQAPGASDTAAPPPGTGDTAAAPAAPAHVPASTGFLDPNAASREELRAVPGMTPAAADALVQGRPYADMRAVDRALAAHLDEKARETVYARVWKPLDLNRASAEEIELIPRVGPKMRHEFEEYRPYRSMEQFRREIGKYVDEAEVARLERYVALP